MGATQAARDADGAREAADRAEAELQGLQASVEAMRRRHVDQLAAQRGTASAALRQAHSGTNAGVHAGLMQGRWHDRFWTLEPPHCMQLMKLRPCCQQ